MDQKFTSKEMANLCPVSCYNLLKRCTSSIAVPCFQYTYIGKKLELFQVYVHTKHKKNWFSLVLLSFQVNKHVLNLIQAVSASFKLESCCSHYKVIFFQHYKTPFRARQISNFQRLSDPPVVEEIVCFWLPIQCFLKPYMCNFQNIQPWAKKKKMESQLLEDVHSVVCFNRK